MSNNLWHAILLLTPAIDDCFRRDLIDVLGDGVRLMHKFSNRINLPSWSCEGELVLTTLVHGTFDQLVVMLGSDTRCQAFFNSQVHVIAGIPRICIWISLAEHICVFGL
jgi:hypothetical protein